MKTKADDLAFASIRENGLTKREYFAGLAIQGLIANTKETIGILTTAKVAVQLANALINALNDE